MTRSPRVNVLGLAALLLAVAAMTVYAQPPQRGQRGQRGGRRPAMMRMGGGPGMMGGLLGLLRNRQVQEEVGVSEEEQEKLREVGEKMMEKLRPLFPQREGGEDMTPEQRRARMEEFRNMSDEEREKRRAEREEAMEKVRKEVEKMTPEVEKQIADILGRPKFKRLKQIQFQLQDIDALVTADIVQALGISEDQQKQIKAVIEERNKKREELREQGRALFQGGFRERSEEEREKIGQQMQDLREKGEQLQQDARKKAMAVLTADQKAKLPDLMGEPFELERPQFGPGGGRQGRGADRSRGQRRPRGQR